MNLRPPQASGAPLRICYVLSHFHPVASGAERQALAQGLELVRRGHTVRVVTQAVPGHPRDEICGGLVIHRWVRPVALGPLFGLTFVTGVLRALRRLRGEYDLIHTHQGLWEAISTGTGKAVGLLRNVPTLVQPASSGYFGEAEELARTRGFDRLRRLILRNDEFAAISADIEAQWLALGVPWNRLSRLASGVDADHFRPGPPDPSIEATLPARPGPRVVFTGRLHPQKNLPVLIRAWPEIHQATGATLILAGDGPDRGALADLVRALGLTAAVHFAGLMADPAALLRSGDLFILPSVAEGMSNSLLEAMSTGLACVASAIGGNTDLLGGPAAVGLLLPFAATDAADWTAPLIDLLSDPTACQQRGAAARCLIEQRYALGVVVGRYETLYADILQRQRLRQWDRSQR